MTTIRCKICNGIFSNVKINKNDNFKGLTLQAIDELLEIDDLVVVDGALRNMLDRVKELKEDLTLVDPTIGEL